MYFGMKEHIGVDADRGMVHTATTANVADVTEVPSLLHGKERHVFGNTGYIARRSAHPNTGESSGLPPSAAW